MESVELMSFQLISNVGMAKSSFIEALHKAQKGLFAEADEDIRKGDDFLIAGHKVHAGMIQQEASGNPVAVNLLLVHAEDQLNSAEMVEIMVQESIKECRRINALEEKLSAS